MSLEIKVKGRRLAMLELERELTKKSEQKSKLKRIQLKEALKAVTPVDTGEARDGWYVDGKSIENNVEHIDQLNEGSSKQAPPYFIERTLLAHKGIRPSGIIVRKK